MQTQPKTKIPAKKAGPIPCGSQDGTCAKCLGRHPAVKRALSRAERDAIHDHRRRLTIAPGGRLSVGARMVIAHLAEGAVKLTPPGDPSQVAGVLFAPGIVGAGDFRNFHAYALSNCELCCFDEPAVKAIFAGHPHLAISFWQHSLDSLSGVRRDASLLNAADATHRVAALFWIIARREQKTAAKKPRAPAVEITLPFTLSGASTLLGLAPETISRRIGALQRAGLVRKTGTRRYLVSRPERLREFMGAGK